MKTHLFRFLRSALGLVIGSFAAAMAFLILPPLWQGLAFPDLAYLLMAAVPGTVIILMFSLPCGFLAHAVLYALKWRWLPVYCLAAAAEAAVYGAICGFTNQSNSDIQNLLAAMPSAATCAAIAWLIRRPDKDGAPQPALSTTP